MQQKHSGTSYGGHIPCSCFIAVVLRRNKRGMNGNLIMDLSLVFMYHSVPLHAITWYTHVQKYERSELPFV